MHVGLAVKRITLFQEGANIKTVQAIAGHASIEMTARYIHERPEDQRAAVGILGAILDSTRQKDDTAPRTITVAAPAAPPVSIRTRKN
ncbi:MAG: tyrosine-type recombinase/integrase [Acidobacteria bacterium]|nr:tyrosine-type recombinase/integrase [Acidobacteriota bacterium]